ncbi:MAG TPA: SCO family protein [Acidobacteriota bacterium]
MNRRTVFRNLTGGMAALTGALAGARAAQEGITRSPAEPQRLADVAPLPCHCGKRGPRDGYFPDVVVTSHEGGRARFYSDLVMGKTVVFNYMYTRCEERCPLYTMNLVKVQRLLGDRVGRDIFMYSLTLDPLADTPKVLRKYAEGHGVGPGWLFLTGKPADMELLRQRLGFVEPDPELDRQKSSHVGLIRYGNERLDRWSACAAQSNPETIVKYISWMEPKG